MAPKNKTQKMSLGNFLGDQSLGSWADEMEDTPLPSSGSTYRASERPSYSSSSNFGGDRGDRGDRDTQYTDRGFSVREELPMPSKPPYTAHLGNLSFEVTQADVQDFLAACSVTSVRLVEDKMDRKPKGFGYVEFATLDGLKEALKLSGTQFQGRNIRVSVAEPPKDRQESREVTDWTRRGPLPELPGEQRRGSDRGGYRQFEAAPEAGERRRTPFEQGDGKVRDFGNWERKGPLAPAAGAMPVRDGPPRSAAPFERRGSPASWGEGRPEGEVRPAREFQDRPPPVERQPTAADMDSKWRERMKPDAPSPVSTPEASTPTSPIAAPAPASRPRLNLAKRTVSEAPIAADGNSTTPSDSKASPFGAARAVDTAARDQEIAEKRLALRKKQEEEAKVREEKQKAEKAAKAAEKPQENGKPANAGGAREAKDGNKDEEKSTAPRPTFEILRRATDAGNGDGEEDLAVDAPANGVITDDKSVKPQEVTRDIQSSAETTTEGTGESMAEDGWATVPAKGNKKARGGNQGARAIAS